MSSSSPWGCSGIFKKSGRQMLEGGPRMLVMTTIWAPCLRVLYTIKTWKPSMTLITHPLHWNTEIYIFCRKTHTSSTVGDFFSFWKTTGKITSILWTPSSHIFYSIRVVDHSWPLAHLQSIRVSVLTYSVERHLPPRSCAMLYQYWIVVDYIFVLCIMSLDWCTFLVLV